MGRDNFFIPRISKNVLHQIYEVTHPLPGKFMTHFKRVGDVIDPIHLPGTSQIFFANNYTIKKNKFGIIEKNISF